MNLTMNSTGPQDCRCVAIATKFQGLCGEIPSNFYQLSTDIPYERYYKALGGRGGARGGARVGLWGMEVKSAVSTGVKGSDSATRLEVGGNGAIRVGGLSG